MSLKHRDTIEVYRDGEQITVYNWANVNQPAVLRGGNPTVELFDCAIGAGDSPETPDYITEWLAVQLEIEFGIDPSRHGIEVIDIESDEVSPV